MNDMKRYRGTRSLHLGLLLTGAVLAAMASGCSKSTDVGTTTDPSVENPPVTPNPEVPQNVNPQPEIAIAPAAHDKKTFVSRKRS